jgi:hypothetical protein
VLGFDDGMTRLFVLTDGVATGVFSDDSGPERVLSLLRERLDDVGDGGIWAEAMVSGSVL